VGTPTTNNHQNQIHALVEAKQRDQKITVEREPGQSGMKRWDARPIIYLRLDTVRVVLVGGVYL
jgi:hypothetical protein